MDDCIIGIVKKEVCTLPCTTILVGKKASYDGSNMIARNDDSGAGKYTVKKFVVIDPDKQPRTYTTRISHLTMELPDDPLRYTACPNVDLTEGEWAECGVNACHVGMTATETITSNPRVLGADPLVTYDETTGKPGGLGEEDLITVVLPYVKSAREGVLRLGALLEEYGTYESNGIGFSDDDEIWWLETIGGHNWMARKLPEDRYAVISNQLGLDEFDFEDAYGAQKEYLCSASLKALVENYHLDLEPGGKFDPRAAFGSHSDSDHVYNTPRTWVTERYFNPNTFKWDGPDARYTPQSDDIPWSLVPEKKITPDDIKYILSNHYQGTPYDPYMHHGDASMAGAYRPIGVNRTSFLGLVQNRPGKDTLEWLAFAANPFNAMTPYYTNVPSTPAYLANTTMDVNTNNCYWTSRLIAAMADATEQQSIQAIERYQELVASRGYELIHKYDPLIEAASDEKEKTDLRLQANQALSDMTEAAARSVLNTVLYNLSNQMKDAYARSDA